MIKPSNPLNLVDIFKQAFIFHLLLRQTTKKYLWVWRDNFTSSTSDNGGNSWSTTVTAFPWLKSAWNYCTQPIGESDYLNFPFWHRVQPMKSSCLLEFCLFNAVGWTIRCPRLWAGSVAAFKTGSQSGCVMNSVFHERRSRDIFTFLQEIIRTCKLQIFFVCFNQLEL